MVYYEKIIVVFQLLVVQENIGRLKGSGIWKIPTGTLEEVYLLFN